MTLRFATSLWFKTVFSYGFRPLFLLFALQGLLWVPYWLLAWRGLLPLPVITENPTLWHAHEMIFGFAGAAIAGFLLTAVANWTNRAPISGVPIVLLSTLWLCARAAWCWPNAAVLPLAMIFDLGFELLLLALFVRELLAANNRRNLKVALVLLIYIALNIGMYCSLLAHNGAARQWQLAALYLIIVLINIIGGRIVPAFTGNWLRQQSPTAIALPPTFSRFDLITVSATILFFVLALVAQRWSWPFAFIAGALQCIRLTRWRGWLTAAEPLLWSLHVAYAWIPIGLWLSGAAALGWVSGSAGIHAFSIGAIASMIIAVASRAALGHTGRPLSSHPLLTLAFVCIALAALTRVLAAIFPAQLVLLPISATAWFFAFALFSRP